jgi:uncharacterized protein
LALILDTGPLLAALDAADPDHAPCAALLLEANEDLVVPALVLAELDYWCTLRLGGDAWLTFLDDVLAGIYCVEAPSSADLKRCRALQYQYRDLGVGIVDASVIALAERFEEKESLRLITGIPRGSSCAYRSASSSALRPLSAVSRAVDEASLNQRIAPNAACAVLPSRASNRGTMSRRNRSGSRTAQTSASWVTSSPSNPQGLIRWNGSRSMSLLTATP